MALKSHASSGCFPPVSPRLMSDCDDLIDQFSIHDGLSLLLAGHF
jgi:hypothetical protein